MQMTPRKLTGIGASLLTAGIAAIATGHFIGGGIIVFAGLASIALVIDGKRKQ